MILGAKKDSIPGQQGYIPNQMNTQAMTYGTTVKSLQNLPDKGSKNNTKVTFKQTLSTWDNGPKPSELIRRVPGQCGYIPSLKAENIYGQTFGNTNKGLHEDELNGTKATLTNQSERFRSSYADSFKFTNSRAKSAPKNTFSNRGPNHVVGYMGHQRGLND